MSVEGLKEYFEYYKKYIYDNVLNENELKNSNLYKELRKLESNALIIPANITSMDQKYDPKRLRIRSDKFLQSISDKNPVFLIAGLIFNKRKILLLLSSWPFVNYEAKKDGSNSFWNFYLDDIETLIKGNSSNIFYKNREEKSHGTYYCFFICDDYKFSENELKTFLNVCRNTKWDNIDSQEWDDFIFPSVPKNVVETVLNKQFKNYCSLYTDPNINNEFKSFCPCGGNVDINYMEKNQITYLQLHHFVPKSWFKNVYLKNSQNHFLAITTVHNPINLIPLCSCCHQSIHKCQQTLFSNESAKNLTIQTFNYIINAYKRFGLYNRFLSYLKEINLTLEDLFKYYVDYVNNE